MKKPETTTTTRTKKLVIRKDTLRTLSESSLRAVAGGMKPESPSCLYCTGSGGSFC
jgi:hypothetical protein